MLRADDQEKVYYGGGRRSDSRRSQTLNFTNTNIQYTKYNIQYIQLFTGRFFVWQTRKHKMRYCLYMCDKQGNTKWGIVCICVCVCDDETGRNWWATNDSGVGRRRIDLKRTFIFNFWLCIFACWESFVCSFLQKILISALGENNPLVRIWNHTLQSSSKLSDSRINRAYQK